MRKTFLGLAVIAAIATPLALASTAEAAVSSATDCVPVKAAPATTHVEYKYVPAANGKASTYWSTSDAGATITVANIKYNRDGNKTRLIIDVPAVDAVTCSVTLPEHLAGEGTYTVVVPYVRGVDTFLYGVQGYDEHVAITQDVTVTKAMAGQFWIGHTAQDGYVIANPDTAQWHIDFQFATAPNEVKLSDPSGLHIDLPDVFDIKHTDYPAGTYWSTQVGVTVTNDTATDQEFRVRYADQQDGNRVWVERAIFTDGQPGNVVKAGESRVMVFDVWYDVVSDSSDVPDDLTLDFGFELG
jgi:hypothetical protein